MPGPNDHHVVMDATLPTGHRLEAGLGADEPPEELRRGASRASVVALKKLREDAAHDIEVAKEAMDQVKAKEKQMAKDRADFEAEKAAFYAEQGKKRGS